MMNDMTVDDKEFKRFQDSVLRQLSSVKEDCKETSQNMTALIRIESDLNRIWDAISRGTTENKDHELRMRVLETDNSGNTKSVKVFDRLVERVILVMIGLTMMYFFKGGH